MTRLVLLGAIIAAVLPAPSASARAYESMGGVCTVEVRVRIGSDREMAQTGPGVVRCVGAMGRSMVDPSAAAASVTGSVRRGAGPCMPVLGSGRLRLAPRRLISFDARSELPFSGSWKALGAGAADAVDGVGTVEGLKLAFAGTARITPGPGTCSVATVQMDLAFMPR